METRDEKSLEVKKKKKKRIFSQKETFPAVEPQQVGDDSPELSELKQKMLYNLERHLGLVAYAANDTGITRQAHYNWLERDKEYKKKVDTLTEAMLDYAESRLLQYIQKEELRAIFFLLQTRGRSRGYSKHLGDNQANAKGFSFVCNVNNEKIVDLLHRL